MRPGILKSIKEAVKAADMDRIFVPADFNDISEPVRVGMCLKRLCESGELTRIMRRLYIKPGCTPPGAEDIAKAIARSYGWNVVPCGETALFLYGLSKTAPVVWTYASDGLYQTYSCNNFVISFKHTGKKSEFINMPYKTALLIQTLRAIGKNKLNNKIIEELAENIGLNDVPEIRGNAKKATSWIQKYLNILCDIVAYTTPRSQNVKSDFYPADLKINTLLGHKVRSKSEALIAYSLHMAGLEYEYEKPLYRKGKIVCRPDFTINYKGKLLYWEHIGMNYDIDYAIDWHIKEQNIYSKISNKLLTTSDKTDIGKQINDILLDTFSYSTA